MGLALRVSVGDREDTDGLVVVAALEGTRRATVRVTDSAANATTQLFTVIVQTPATSIPVFTGNPPATAKVGCVYTYDANAASASGATRVVFQFIAFPSGMRAAAAMLRE